MNVTFMFQFCAEMAIPTRWRLHCLFFLDGWEQIDFTLDTLPWVSMFHLKKNSCETCRLMYLLL